MRLKTLAVFVLAGVLLSLALHPQGSAGPPAPPAADPSNVTLHFKGDGLTTADPAAGNSTEEKASASGRPYGARRTGTSIGEWSFLPKGDFQVQGSFKAELWAQSPSGAKNAGFRLNFYIGSNLIKGMFSDRADVSSPHKFTISDSVTANAKAGVSVKCGLVWLSDPNYVVGPSGGGEFLYGSKDHDSRIILTLNGVPVTMNVTGYDREKDAIKINAKINDSLGMDPAVLGYELMMTGPANILPDQIGRPTVVAGDNGTSVSWRWMTKNSGAKAGMYTLTITVAYCNDTKFSNSTQMQITPSVAAPKEEGLAVLVKGTNLFFMVGIILIVVIVLGSIGGIALRRRRRRRARLRAERDLAMAEAA